jgi:hypothetical protein
MANPHPALLSAILMGAVVPALAHGERVADGPTIAIEMYIEPALALRAPEMNPDQYEAYLRELFRSIVPEAPLVSGAQQARDASHVIVVDFAATDERGMARVSVGVKHGRGTTRRMELARVASAILVATDAAAVEAFLRQQASRIITLYRLRVTDVATPSGGGDTPSSAELGMTLVMDPHVGGPPAEAVSSAIRTTLAEELPGITLVGPFQLGEDGGRARPMLTVEFERVSDTGGRNRVRVILRDRERGELSRADEVYDDGDADRAIRFLRETMRTVAGKLLEDPLLFPLVPPGNAVLPDPVPIPIEREWEDQPAAAASDPAATATAPAATAQAAAPSAPRSSWRRPLRIATLSGIGVGLLGLGLGAWQGIVAKQAEADFRSADAQHEALDAKQRSETAGARANLLIGAGAAVTVVASTVLTLDLLGIFQSRPSARAAQPGSTRQTREYCRVGIGVAPSAFVVHGAFSLP